MFRRTGLGLLAVAVGAVVLLALAGVGFGVRGADDDGVPVRPEPANENPVTATAAVAAGDERELRLTIRGSSDRLTAAGIVEQLADGDVLHIRVGGMLPGRRGTVRQCVRTADGFGACTNAFPVQAGADGSAYFQYELMRTDGPCHADDDCAVVVNDAGGGTAYAYTVFGGRAPEAATMTVTPRGPYAPGDEIAVTVAPLAPGRSIHVAYCAPTCDAVVRAVADDQGRARATMRADACPRDERCAIVAFGVVPRDASLVVRFSAGPGARYEAARLVPGLVVAAALLLAASWVARRTDWNPPGEAATPELDAAQL